MRVFPILLLPLLAAVSACSVQVQPYLRGPTADEIATMSDKIGDEVDRAFIREIYRAALDRDRAVLTSAFVDEIGQADLETGFTSFYQYMPEDRPVRSDLVTWVFNTHVMNDADPVHTLTAEYVLEASNGQLHHLYMQSRRAGGGDPRMASLISNHLPTNGFEMPDRWGWLRMLMAGLAIASPLVLFAAISVRLRIHNLEKPILWTAAILITAPTFTFNWTSQAIDVIAPFVQTGGTTVNVSLFSWIVTGSQVARAGDYHPWMLTIGLPLGAAWFLLRHWTGGLRLKT
ncbi:hypothetical protein [Maricaulis sp.]|uniref:hypothetical protein n=1 Tax=Maricaulis sp. TaxID=1486257 RepID=UPI00262B615F|nr:hypothetical protein [Maricaulis sp.]